MQAVYTSGPSPGVTLSDSYSATPTAIFIPVPEPGTYVPDTNYYVLSVRATDLAGCTATDEIKINVFIGSTVYVPTAFSPQMVMGWMMYLSRCLSVWILNLFRLFNRYGEMVLWNKPLYEGWDGMFKGKAQANGAYVWVFKGKDRRRDVINKGTVMLVR